MRHITLLGPQRLQPTIAPEIDALDDDGQVAVVTAGWQEREAENDELQQHLDRPVVDLRLHLRAEQIFVEDEEFFLAHRARQDTLRRLQRLYRFRLNYVLEPARRLMRRKGQDAILRDERESAIEAIRTLDREHLARIRTVHDDFDARWRLHERPTVARHREELREILEHSVALAIAGGHVAVLLNRLRLFGVLDLQPALPVFAWSAGAMALSDRVVLFHDSPPQGAGSPEVLEVGLGLVPRLVVLPHARQRLRLDDPVRVELLVRRFAPARSLAFDGGAVLRCGADCWAGTPETLELRPDGSTARIEGPLELP